MTLFFLRRISPKTSKQYMKGIILRLWLELIYLHTLKMFICSATQSVIVTSGGE